MNEALKSTILLVEDHQDFAEILEFELKGLGLDVFTCDGSDSANEILSSEARVDLILTDYRFSNSTAQALLSHEKIRQNAIPVLVMTGLDKSYDESIFNSGACGILRKPFELKELEHHLSVCLKDKFPNTK